MLRIINDRLKLPRVVWLVKVNFLLLYINSQCLYITVST